MNILFLLKSLGIGGVEVVTVTLANKFVEECHNVSIFARCQREKTLHERLSPNVKVYMGFGENAGKKNVDALHDIYVQDKIDVVVNQWGLSYVPILLARRAQKGYPVKVISFYHNDPSTNGKLKAIDNALDICKNPIKRTILNLKRYVAKVITSSSMKYTYVNSDRFMVLSPSYISHLRSFINVGEDEKIGVLVNPVTIETEGFSYSPNLKNKEIIYCGRLDYTQKRTMRLIETWALLEKKHPEWRFSIIGDGPSKTELEEMVNKYALKNVSFEGYKNPLNYYKRASILLQTSEYEGFPLVIAESMSFGVIPCVYGSFSAVYDIIVDGINGLVLPKSSDVFSAEEMSNKLSPLMSDIPSIQRMACEALKTSNIYSIDNIYNQWMSTFTQMNLCTKV